MVGLQWKVPLKWMIWGCPHFRKPPYISIYISCRYRKPYQGRHIVWLTILGFCIPWSAKQRWVIHDYSNSQEQGLGLNTTKRWSQVDYNSWNIYPVRQLYMDNIKRFSTVWPYHLCFICHVYCFFSFPEPTDCDETGIPCGVVDLLTPHGSMFRTYSLYQIPHCG